MKVKEGTWCSTMTKYGGETSTFTPAMRSHDSESTSISCFVSVDVWLAQMQDGGRGRASPSAREIESVQSVGMARGRERERKEY